MARPMRHGVSTVQSGAPSDSDQRLMGRIGYQSFPALLLLMFSPAGSRIYDPRYSAGRSFARPVRADELSGGQRQRVAIAVRWFRNRDPSRRRTDRFLDLRNADCDDARRISHKEVSP